MSTIATSSIGAVEFDGNELTVRSSVDDPPKLRLAAVSVGPAVTLGGLSGSIARQDGAQDEKVLVLWKHEAERGGYIDAFLQAPHTSDDAGMRRVYTLSLDRGLELAVPVQISRLWHEGGQFVTIYQADGNVVTYNTHGGADESQWSPVWSSFGGTVGA